MTQEEKRKKAAWDIVRAVLESGQWQIEMPHYGNNIVEVSDATSKALAAHGCFADEYGDSGSFEVSLAVQYAKSRSLMFRGFLNPDISIWADIADRVRELHSTGCLTKEEIARVRLFKEDEEKAEAERAEAEARAKAEAEARAKAEKEAEKERQAQIAKKAEIEKRIKELKNQAKGGK